LGLLENNKYEYFRKGQIQMNDANKKNSHEKPVKMNHKMGRERLTDSFRYASQGLKFAFDNEQNFRIHVVTAFVALFAGIIFALSLMEWVILVVLMGLVLAAELFNTALEATIDLFSRDIHPLAKVAKDSASAAVFVLTIVSFVCGMIIFLPKVIQLFLK